MKIIAESNTNTMYTSMREENNNNNNTYTTKLSSSHNKQLNHFDKKLIGKLPKTQIILFCDIITIIKHVKANTHTHTHLQVSKIKMSRKRNTGLLGYLRSLLRSI